MIISGCHISWVDISDLVQLLVRRQWDGLLHQWSNPKCANWGTETFTFIKHCFLKWHPSVLRIWPWKPENWNSKIQAISNTYNHDSSCCNTVVFSHFIPSAAQLPSNCWKQWGEQIKMSLLICQISHKLNTLFKGENLGSVREIRTCSRVFPTEVIFML